MTKAQYLIFFTFFVASSVHSKEEEKTLLLEEKFRPSRQISPSVVFSSASEPFDLDNKMDTDQSSNLFPGRQARAMQNPEGTMSPVQSRVSKQIADSNFPYEFWKPNRYRKNPPTPISKVKGKKSYGYFYGKQNLPKKSIWNVPPIKLPQDLVSEVKKNIKTSKPAYKEIPKYPSNPTPQYGRHPGSTESPPLIDSNKLVYWNRPANERVGRPFEHTRHFKQRPKPHFAIEADRVRSGSNSIEIVNIDRSQNAPPHVFYPIKKSPSLKMHILKKGINQTSYQPVNPFRNRHRSQTKNYRRPTSFNPQMSITSEPPKIFSKHPATPKYNFLDYSRYNAHKNVLSASHSGRKKFNEQIVDLIKKKTNNKVQVRPQQIPSGKRKPSEITFPGPVANRYDDIDTITYKANEDAGQNVLRSHGEFSQNNVKNPSIRPRPGPSYYNKKRPSFLQNNKAEIRNKIESFSKYVPLPGEGNDAQFYEDLKKNFNKPESVHLSGHHKRPPSFSRYPSTRPHHNPSPNRPHNDHRLRQRPPSHHLNRPQPQSHIPQPQSHRPQPPSHRPQPPSHRPQPHAHRPIYTAPSKPSFLQNLLSRTPFKRPISQPPYQSQAPSPNSEYFNSLYSPRPTQSPSHHRRPPPKDSYYYTDNSLKAKLRRIWDAGFRKKPSPYRDNNYLAEETDYSGEKTIMERIASIQSAPAAAMLVPGGFTALGLGLAYYYFNYVWYPTPVVTARLSKLLLTFTDNKIFDEKDKTEMEKVMFLNENNVILFYDKRLYNN